MAKWYNAKHEPSRQLPGYLTNGKGVPESEKRMSLSPLILVKKTDNERHPRGIAFQGHCMDELLREAPNPVVGKIVTMVKVFICYPVSELKNN